MANLARVQRIIDYVEDHLQDDLDLDSLAAQANYSLWHFQKIFSAVVGDGLKEYIRSRKLTAALRELTEDETSIREISKRYGFGSQEAFTRAFKKMFGCNPGACRSQRAVELVVRTKARVTYEYLDHLYQRGHMEPKIIEIPARWAVGMVVTFISALSPDKNNSKVLPVLWQNFHRRGQELGVDDQSTYLGVCQPLAANITRIQRHNCFYLAGVEVKTTDVIPAGMCALVVPAGRYAVFVHRGYVQTITHTVRYIYGSWLPKSGLELRDAPEVEVYTPSFRPDAEDSEIEIQIPIQ
jgi:AraC family transcriptional regulator